MTLTAEEVKQLLGADGAACDPMCEICHELVGTVTRIVEAREATLQKRITELNAGIDKMVSVRTNPDPAPLYDAFHELIRIRDA